MTARISIVVPSFNQGQFIKATLDSVLEQDYSDLECLVMDGGSTDDTLDVLRSIQDSRLAWVSEPDRGQSHAINKGIQRATGELVSYLNSDDLLLPGALSTAVKALNDPAVALVYGDCNVIDEQGDQIGFIQGRPFNLADILLGKGGFPQQGSVWRRNVLDQIGMFDESLHFTMDMDYWLRMAAAGYTLHYVPGTRAAYRLHATSKTVNQRPKFWSDWDKMMDKFFAMDSLPPEVRKLESAAHRPYNKLYVLIAFWELGQRAELRPHLLSIVRGGAPTQHRFLALAMLIEMYTHLPLSGLLTGANRLIKSSVKLPLRGH